MRVLLVQLDGKLPSVALMRLAAHHRTRGDEIEHVYAPSAGAFERGLWDGPPPDRVYASLIFTWSRPLAERLLALYPRALVGGTGWDLGKPRAERASLEALGVGLAQDYAIYPGFRPSIGFTQRGCRLACAFCDVPKAEGRVRAEQSIMALWRGPGHPGHLLLLDNDFFGQDIWRDLVAEMRAGGFRICFSQGINARLIGDEEAEALGSLDFYDDAFKARRIYTAWDNKRDEARLFTGLRRLVRYGVKPDEIMVYMLIGFEPGETTADRLERHAKLRAFGCRPYPMPYKRTPELRGFARWVIRRYDHVISWERWEAARYQVRNLKARERDAAQAVMFA